MRTLWIISFSVVTLLFRQAYGQDAAPISGSALAPNDKPVYTLFNPTPDSALRSFASDRPTKSYSPITVDAGRVQFETDLFSYTHTNVGGVTTRLYTTADPVFKLGVTSRIDLEIQFNGYNWLSKHDTANRQKTVLSTGAGDLVLRTKVNVWNINGGPSIAMIPYVKLPVASAGIGNGSVEGGVIAPISFPLPWNFTGLVMSEVDVLQNDAAPGHHFNFTQLLNLSHPIGDKTTVFAELYSAIGTNAHTPAVYTFDAAISYLITPALQIDAGINVGLNRGAPNLQAYTGLSQRF